MTLQEMAEQYAYKNAPPGQYDFYVTCFKSGFLACKQLAAEKTEEGSMEQWTHYQLYGEIQNLGNANEKNKTIQQP
jgi:hypothetical protein